jgi:hypothetical protein
LKITSAEIRNLLDAATGVEHRRQQSVIAASLQGAPVDRFENRVNLLVFQVIDRPLSRTLEGNAKDALGQGEILWISRGHKMKERMNGGKSNVSRGNSVFTFLFQVSQEREDSRRIQIREVESRNRLIPLSGKEAQQQNNAVTVAVDGVRTGSTKAGKMIREVVADYRAE